MTNLQYLVATALFFVVTLLVLVRGAQTLNQWLIVLGLALFGMGIGLCQTRRLFGPR